MEVLNLGIDDAGRGPVIGPMIIAGCLLTEESERELKKLGVKDSKDLTPKRREFLDSKIKELAEAYEIVIISPKKIDGDEKNRLKLNEVEAESFAEIINKINKGFRKINVYADCPSVSIQKWSDYLKQKVENLSNLSISCEHKADRNHVSVSAASILAKNVREREMHLLKKKYGKEIGSGYPSDPSTVKFLEKYAKLYENHGIFRKSWATWRKAFEKNEQKKLF